MDVFLYLLCVYICVCLCRIVLLYVWLESCANTIPYCSLTARCSHSHGPGRGRKHNENVNQFRLLDFCLGLVFFVEFYLLWIALACNRIKKTAQCIFRLLGDRFYWFKAELFSKYAFGRPFFITHTTRSYRVIIVFLDHKTLINRFESKAKIRNKLFNFITQKN